MIPIRAFAKEIGLKQRTLTLMILIAIVLCAAATWAQPPQFPSLSADMKMTGHRGEDSTGKMFFSGETKHMRMEIAARGHNMIMLVDSTNTANPKSTMIMPDQKMYMEMSAYGAGPGMRQRGPEIKPYDPTNPCASEEGTTCKKVGTETMNGYVCDKWEFTGKENRTVWISQKLHFPIKSVSQDGTSVEFSNIKEGPQDASLFTVPAGYQKMDMGAMMGGKAPQ
ncbi:hypothetical protein Acid345_2010 [Candidatus Koribacter versatilis Ellin345]|uniref:DUF4412 domain-containing protein n=1 Tax=Koribacter versatilis (strain Ellin345) TaxID=204669 RepID=Q1IQ39_KORVE|nr:hypothetical protein Acid345_2010 [Candidatus Koribacter versatilis Ellin345]